MAKRSTSKPLYELMVSDRRRGPATPSPPVQDVETDDLEIDAPPGAGRLIATLSAGRSIRLPVGYLVLAIPSVIVLVIGAYMFGSWRGAAQAKADGDRIIADLVGEDPAWKAADPLTEGSNVGGGAGEDDDREAARPPAADTATGGMPGESSPPTAIPRPRPPAGGDGLVPDAERWAGIETDPRDPGSYYLVLAETRLEGARRLAEFLRENGLEAYIVPSNNPGLRRVVVLPGFDSSSESDPDVARLVEAVRRVGRAWKAEYPFESDLSDAYLAQP